MDEAGHLVAKIQSSMVVPFMYKMVHTGTLPKFMQKKLDKTDGGKKELYNGFLNMFGIGKGGSLRHLKSFRPMIRQGICRIHPVMGWSRWLIISMIIMIISDYC